MTQNEQFDTYCLRGECTDVGMRRQANEDSCRNGITINGLVATVCDGMGGHVGGATASGIAVDTIFGVLDSRFFENPRDGISTAIDAANKAILDYAAEHPELQGMGSTCVILIVRNGKVYIGHVGDSRIYLIRDRRITQLTTDHSYVQMLVDAGHITKEEAEHHPRKNEITNALGIPAMQPATVMDGSIVPEAGDCFVLCSDGLSGMVSDSNIAKIVSNHEMHIQQRAASLVEAANAAGGVDNISVELIEFASSPAAAAANRTTNGLSLNKIIIGAVVLAVVVTAALFLLWPKGGDDKAVDGKEAVTDSLADNKADTALIGKPTESETLKAVAVQLKTIQFDGKNPFLTISARPDGYMVISCTGADNSRQERIIDNAPVEFELANFNIHDERIACSIERQSNDYRALFRLSGQKAPGPKQSFTLSVTCRNGKTINISFTLSPRQNKNDNSGNGRKVLPKPAKPTPKDSDKEPGKDGEPLPKPPVETPPLQPAPENGGSQPPLHTA